MSSNAEMLLAVQLEQAGIPFEREVRFAPPRRWRADFQVEDGAWPILVEIDGGAYVAGRHTRGEGFEKDAEKASAAAILGYRVIRCTPRQVEDGRALEWIRQALGTGGGGVTLRMGRGKPFLRPAIDAAKKASPEAWARWEGVIAKPTPRPKVRKPLRSKPHGVNPSLREAVFARDTWLCQWCKVPGGRLEAAGIPSVTYPLSPAQLEALAAWWRVGSVTGAAAELHLAVQTVKNQLVSARRRSGVTTTLDAVKANWKALAHLYPDDYRS